MNKHEPAASPHMAPDDYDDCGEHESCGRCGGDGVIMLSEAGPSIWGEDCFCEEDRPITCPECKGSGCAELEKRGAK